MNLPFEVLNIKKDRAGNVILRIRILKETIQEATEKEREEFEKMFSPIPESAGYIRSDR